MNWTCLPEILSCQVCQLRGEKILAIVATAKRGARKRKKNTSSTYTSTGQSSRSHLSKFSILLFLWCRRHLCISRFFGILILCLTEDQKKIFKISQRKKKTDSPFENSNLKFVFEREREKERLREEWLVQKEM